MSRARDLANRTIASAALPKAGGAMTGAITTNSTFDGIDIATRDAVLTSTTTTAGAALPKAGGTMTGTLTVGVDDTGHDVKFFGASAGAFMLYDEDADTLEIRGAAADATTSTGKLLLSTALTDINDGDVIGRIDFQAPLEGGGTDAIVVGASIWAEADDTFAADNNETELVFATGASGAAVERMRIESNGITNILAYRSSYIPVNGSTSGENSGQWNTVYDFSGATYHGLYMVQAALYSIDSYAQYMLVSHGINGTYKVGETTYGSNGDIRMSGTVAQYQQNSGTVTTSTAVASLVRLIASH